jgi:hypothetical protein
MEQLYAVTIVELEVGTYVVGLPDADASSCTSAIATLPRTPGENELEAPNAIT